MKAEVFSEFLSESNPSDSAWAIALLLGNRPKRGVLISQLQSWVQDLAQVEDWLWDHCLRAVGDVLETVTLLIPGACSARSSSSLTEWIERGVVGISVLPETAQRELVEALWASQDPSERYLFNRLLTGSFRQSVPLESMVNAIATFSTRPAHEIHTALCGEWLPSATWFENLTRTCEVKHDPSQPYLFCSVQEGSILQISDWADWTAELKWDGIRCQVVRREGRSFIWTKSGFLPGDRFPEVVEWADSLPSEIVLDGILVGYGQDRPMPSAELEKRLVAKGITKRQLSELRAEFIPFDILERAGVDLRTHPHSTRRDLLEQLVSGDHCRRIVLSNHSEFEVLRARVRHLGGIGLMLKHNQSAYGLADHWMTFSPDPISFLAVLTYATPDESYAFALWSEVGELVTFAKATSGLPATELEQLERTIKQLTLEKLGPVRTVTPSLVVEIEVGQLQFSPRQKSGFLASFVRMVALKPEMDAKSADRLADVRRFVEDN